MSNILNSNNISAANSLVEELTQNGQKVKIIKKDNGLLERENIDKKVILAEDNRQVLFG